MNENKRDERGEKKSEEEGRKGVKKLENENKRDERGNRREE